ncbi:MAG TPA: hypothetical protein VI796_06940 [Candidatus Thermoplasmatota archaeon]|nr:hypothetical protein [Candidatus Thermoplasmatota archaeon]
MEFSSPNCSRYVGVDAVILVCWFQVAGQDCSVGQATYILPLPPHVQLYGGCSPLTDWVYGPFLDWVVCVATSYYYCGPPPIGP